MKRYEGPSWILIGVAVSLYAFKMGLGTFHEPGAGFIAFLTGLFLVALGILMLTGRRRDLQARSSVERNETRNPARTVFRLLYPVALLVLYGLLLERLGYILTTFLLMFGLFYAAGRRLGLAFTAAALSSGVTYIVFETWLQTQLPRGLLPWW